MQQQWSTIQDAGNTTPPESSDEESTSDSVMVQQLSFVIERLAKLEKRFDRLEEQVKSGRRVHVATQGQVANLTASPRPYVAASPVAQAPVPSTPVTPRRSKTASGAVQSGQTLHAPPFQAHVIKSEVQPLYQAASMMQAGPSTHPSNGKKPLPNHYFGANPISTPTEAAKAIRSKRPAKKSYFVVTQGIEPGIYGSWPETAVMAKSVGGVWVKADTMDDAIDTYEEWYHDGLCLRISP